MASRTTEKSLGKTSAGSAREPRDLSIRDLATLRRELAGLYDRPSDAMRIADDAGLSVRYINFDGSMEMVWYETLREAQEQNRLVALVEIALHDYPNNPRLREAASAILGPGTGGGETLPETFREELSRQELVPLREVFVGLYPDSHSAKRIVADVGLNSYRIGFTGSAQEFWDNILQEAQKQGGLRALVKVAMLDYPYHPQLLEVATTLQKPLPMEGGVTTKRPHRTPAAVEALFALVVFSVSVSFGWRQGALVLLVGLLLLTFWEIARNRSTQRMYDAGSYVLDISEAGLKWFRSLGRRERASKLMDEGISARAQKHWTEAIGSLQRALLLAEELRDVRIQREVLCDLGLAEIGDRKWQEAETHLRRAADLTRETNDPRTRVKAHLGLGEVFAYKGALDEALVSYQLARSLQEVLHDRSGATETERLIVALREKKARQAVLRFSLEESRWFFETCGFEVKPRSDVTFDVAPRADTWKQRGVEERSLLRVLDDHALTHDEVLALRSDAGPLHQCFVVTDLPVREDAWLQIAALRAADTCTVIPVPFGLIREARTADRPVQVQRKMERHVERFLGSGVDPYDVREPVSDALNFFGREGIATELRRALEDGHPVGLFGLRKMGKSSLLRYLETHLPFPTARLDLQADSEPAALAARILRAWKRDASVRLKREIEWPEVDPASASDMTAQVTAIQHTLDRQGFQRFAVLLDEVELLLPPPGSSGEEIRRRLSFLRALRGLCQESGRLAILVAGINPAINRTSFGDVQQAEQNPFYHFLQERWLEPLTQDACVQMVRNLGGQVGLRLTDEAVRLVAEASGGHPFLARQIASLALRQRDRQPGEIEAATMRRALDHFMVDDQYASSLRELWQEVTLESMCGPFAATNRDVLVRLAGGDAPETAASLGTSPALQASLHELTRRRVISLQRTTGVDHPTVGITIGLFREWVRRNHSETERT